MKNISTGDLFVVIATGRQEPKHKLGCRVLTRRGNPLWDGDSVKIRKVFAHVVWVKNVGMNRNESFTRETFIDLVKSGILKRV